MRSGEILLLRDRNRSDPSFNLSGDMLRLRDWYREPLRDLDGLRDTYREPASDTERARPFSELGLRDLLGDRWGLLLLLGLRLGLRLLSLPASLLPSIASSKRLFLGPSSPLSSRTSRFVIRGKMISQTRSSCSSWSTNSSINVRWYPPGGGQVASGAVGDVTHLHSDILSSGSPSLMVLVSHTLLLIGTSFVYTWRPAPVSTWWEMRRRQGRRRASHILELIGA